LLVALALGHAGGISRTDPFKPSDNVVVSPFSVFYGGAITEHIGAFAQVTHNAPPPGGFPDPFGHTWTWDNVDLRYANTAKLGGLDVIYGITANNNPTVQDVWNTTPAWTFPICHIDHSTHACHQGAHRCHLCRTPRRCRRLRLHQRHALSRGDGVQHGQFP
jgi:hypothetical protein